MTNTMERIGERSHMQAILVHSQGGRFLVLYGGFSNQGLGTCIYIHVGYIHVQSHLYSLLQFE